MQIHFISLFPEIFTSFLETSLIKKAQESWILTMTLLNPRNFCRDKHQQIDDEVYGGGAGMLIKAEPIIDAVESLIKSHKMKKSDFSILFPAPAKEVFNQKIAYGLSKKEHLIFICGRYEGIDYRAESYLSSIYPEAFKKISLGSFIVLWGETPSMVMTEAIVRLIPGVIKESASWIEESYSMKDGMQKLEAPNYTRPLEVKGIPVPEVLLSGDDLAIQQWKNKQETKL